jgi:O-antigen/teichoic acid export membrane protein
MIYRMGIQYVGINGVFSSILSVLNIVELGFGSAIVYSMFKPIATDDNITLCALLNFYRRVYRIVGSVILALGIVCLPFLNRIIKDSNVEINLYIVFLLYLLNVVLSYFLFAYQSSVLNAFQRTDIISIIESSTIAVSGILQIVILYSTHNFYLFLAIAILFTIVRNIAISVMVRRLFPDIQAKGKISDELYKSVNTQVKGVCITKICNVTRNAFDSIFVSAFLGVAIAGMYSNYYYVMNALAGIMTGISPALLGGVGNSIQLEPVRRNYGNMMRINSIYMIISGWITSCLICMYQPFMRIWAGEKNMFSFDVVILFSIYFYIKQMGNVRAIYSDAAGLFWENRHRSLAEAIANLFLNYLFVKKFGVIGIVGATIISLFAFGFVASAHVSFKYYFKTGMRQYLMAQARLAFYTVIVSAITYNICSMIRAEDVFGLVLRLLVCSLLSLVLFAFLSVISKPEKRALAWLYNNVIKSR